jgi:hypothetical protein
MRNRYLIVLSIHILKLEISGCDTLRQRVLISEKFSHFTLKQIQYSFVFTTIATS